MLGEQADYEESEGKLNLGEDKQDTCATVRGDALIPLGAHNQSGDSDKRKHRPVYAGLEGEHEWAKALLCFTDHAELCVELIMATSRKMGPPKNRERTGVARAAGQGPGGPTTCNQLQTPLQPPR
jgi:hypothetical protein